MALINDPVLNQRLNGVARPLATKLDNLLIEMEQGLIKINESLFDHSGTDQGDLIDDGRDDAEGVRLLTLEQLFVFRNALADLLDYVGQHQTLRTAAQTVRPFPPVVNG